MLGFGLAWAYISLMLAVAIAVSAYIHLPYCVQKTLFSLSRSVNPVGGVKSLTACMLTSCWFSVLTAIYSKKELPLRPERRSDLRI